MTRLILRDFLVYLPARVVPAAVALLGIPIVTRLLHPAEYGAYLLALTTLTLISAFANSWLTSIVIRFRPTFDNEALTRSIRPLIAASVMLGVVIWLIAATLYGAPLKGRELMLAGCAWIVSSGLAEYTAACLRADERAIGYSVIVSLRSIGGMAAGIALAWWLQPSASMILLGAAVAALLILFPIARRRPGDTPAQAPTATAAVAEHSTVDRRALLRYAIPVAFSNLFVSGLSFANRYIIGATLGVRQVAIYGAAYDIAERSIFFLNAMMLLSSSVMAIKVFEKDGEAAAGRLLSSLIRFYLLIACLIVSGISALSADIVNVMLPKEYAPGAAILPIVSLSAMIVGIIHRYSLILSFHKRTDIVMVCTLFALAINLGSCLLAVRYFGIMGGAIGCFCGYASWLVVIRLAVRRYGAPPFPWRAAFRIALAGGGCALTAHAGATLGSGAWRLVLGGVAGSLAYLVMLLVTGEIAFRDIVRLVPRTIPARR